MKITVYFMVKHRNTSLKGLKSGLFFLYLSACIFWKFDRSEFLVVEI